ncbi:hypothetical protein NPIL_352881 [Nephila pilipes]|uniref:Uncharacterized protein n=1 Tax=Nephila pilipes TaxID=299642 RepID=A0A8X6PL53_NEPPI|nr:hypothetical protein NPIL_352881 [Nephila pilipes]
MIFNRPDIICSFKKFLRRDRHRKINVAQQWSRMVSRVKKLVERLQIPREISKQLDIIVLPIGHQIMLMICFENLSPHFKYVDLKFPVYYWNVYGTVNTTRIEELIVQDVNNDIYFRFVLACNNCFKRAIDKLFGLLTDQQKDTFRDSVERRHLSSYWTYRLSRDLPTFMELISHDEINRPPPNGYSAHQFAFLYTLVNGSKSGIEYFMNYLRPDEYEVVLENHAHYLTVQCSIISVFTDDLRPRSNLEYVDALYFLLSKLNEEQRSKILHKYSFRILNCFLRYPFYGVFNTYANTSVSNLATQDIVSLLKYIFSLEVSYTYMFDLELFNNLWNNCTKTQNELVISYLNSRRSEPEMQSLLDRIKTAVRNR